MKISRRNFIAAAPIASLAVSQLNISAMGQALRGRTILSNDPLSGMSAATFLPYVGTDFTFRDAMGRATTLRLAAMQDRKPIDYVSTGPGEECFALRFSGSARQALVQDSYSVEHFALGGFSLFITEAGTNGRRSMAEALFNRLVH